MKGKRVLITGASSGIGRALALELAGRGYSLGLAARRLPALEAVRDEIEARSSGGRVAVRQLDVTDYGLVSRILGDIADELSGLDIVIANAGIGRGEKVGQGNFEDSRQTVETNLIGAMATVDAAVAYFLATSTRGHIVGISSVAAKRGLPRNASYGASKAGLAVYLEAVRAEVLPRGIDVTVLFPGFIDTPLNDMLPSRPFLIPVTKGAAIIADLMEKKVKAKTVPVFPWNVVSLALKLLPTRLAARL